MDNNERILLRDVSTGLYSTLCWIIAAWVTVRLGILYGSVWIALGIVIYALSPVVAKSRTRRTDDK